MSRGRRRRRAGQGETERGRKRGKRGDRDTRGVYKGIERERGKGKGAEDNGDMWEGEEDKQWEVRRETEGR